MRVYLETTSSVAVEINPRFAVSVAVLTYESRCRLRVWLVLLVTGYSSGPSCIVLYTNGSLAAFQSLWYLMNYSNINSILPEWTSKGKAEVILSTILLNSIPSYEVSGRSSSPNSAAVLGANWVLGEAPRRAPSCDCGYGSLQGGHKPGDNKCCGGYAWVVGPGLKKVVCGTVVGRTGG